MNLQDTKHNLKIVGKIFLVLGILIVPVSIVSYSSIYFLSGADWWHLDDFVDIGLFHFRIPFEMLYVIPAFHILSAAVLIFSGLGLVYDTPWSKKLSLVPAVVMLFFFPIGTALGFFLIYLLQQESKEEEISLESTEESN